MPLLRPSHVARLRQLVETRAMPDSCAVTRDVMTSDGFGGFTRAPATVATVPCRLRPAGQGAEQVIADRAGFQQPYAVELPTSVDARPGDRLVIAGRAFEIGGVVRAGAWSLITTAVAQELG